MVWSIIGAVAFGLCGCLAVAVAEECDRIDARSLAEDSAVFTKLLKRSRPVVLTNVDALSSVWQPAHAWRQWTEPGGLAQRFGDERVVASVVAMGSRTGPSSDHDVNHAHEAAAATFESTVPTESWSGAAQFWQRWLGLGLDAVLPREVWSLRDRSGLNQGPYDPCDPTLAPPSGQTCVRFTVDRVVSRPAKVGTRLAHVLNGQLASAFGTNTAQVYVQYQGLPDAMTDALGGNAAQGKMPQPPPHCPLEPEFVGLWVGGAKTVAQLHYDPSENLAFQLAGHREWTLFPPSAGAALQEGFMLEGDLLAAKTHGAAGSPTLALHQNISAATVADAAFSFYTSPLSLTEATSVTAAIAISPHTCTVRAGEGLFVPAHWWHSVRATPSPGVGTFPPLSLAINYWFRAMHDVPLGCTSCAADEHTAGFSDKEL
jgi:hypothetical protein